MGPLTSLPCYIHTLYIHTIYIHTRTHTHLQPVCDMKYDDSFEMMELDVNGWKSKFQTTPTHKLSHTP